MLNLTVFVNEVLSTICFANFRNKEFQVWHFLFKETFSNTSIHPSKVFNHFVNIFVKKTADFFNISKWKYKNVDKFYHKNILLHDV